MLIVPRKSITAPVASNGHWKWNCRSVGKRRQIKSRTKYHGKFYTQFNLRCFKFPFHSSESLAQQIRQHKCNVEIRSWGSFWLFHCVSDCPLSPMTSCAPKYVTELWIVWPHSNQMTTRTTMTLRVHNTQTSTSSTVTSTLVDVYPLCMVRRSQVLSQHAVAR